MKRQQRLVTLWFVAADILSALVAALAAFALRFYSGLFSVELGIPSFEPYAGLLPFVALLWPVIFSTQRLYRALRSRSLIDEAFSIGLAVTVATLVLFGLDAYYRLYHLSRVPDAQSFQYARLFILLFVALDIVLTVTCRTLIRRRLAILRSHGFNARRVLVAGAGHLGRTLVRKMREHPEYGFRLVGFVDDDPAKQGGMYESVPVLGRTSDVLRLVREEKVDELLLALPWSAHDKMLKILNDTGKEYLDVKVVPDLLEHIAIRASLEDLGGLPILNLTDDPLHTWDWILKRLFDIVAAGVGLVVLSPFLLIVAALVKRSSAGPIFYLQERMGLDGKSFNMCKFRTMSDDAEASTGPVFAADEDPRCTPIGRFLRRHWIDEFPQLWNVIRGDMSIVGPRPERPSFVSEFKEHIPQYMLRHKMRSGITGWAQVNGWRGNTSISKRIEHDLYYMTHWSLALDLKIVCMTLMKGLR